MIPRAPTTDLQTVIAVLAVDAGIAPWDARDRLTVEDANAILDLLETRARAANRR